MIPALRRSFNRNFSNDKYQRLLADLRAVCATPIQFRVSETPCFFPQSLLDTMCAYGAELLSQLVDNRAYQEASNVSIPPRFNVPHEDAKPLFVQVDFGIVRKNGAWEPKLVELQGFPSIYAFQSLISQQYRAAFHLPSDLKVFLGGLDEQEFHSLLRRAILGGHPPEAVVLLEIDPHLQKTRPDFILTERICNIRTVNIRDVVKQGRKLFYVRDNKLAPIERIYNRAIVDELVRRDVKLAFDYRDELDIEWAGHPNWYFRLSKFSIPFLRHSCVPQTWFLDQVNGIPGSREEFLLKPLYSFAGSGIIFAPTEKDIAAIPAAQRSHYILQERLSFEPVIATPHGPTQAEVRIMYIWIEQLVPVLTLVRMGRGKMMGVDHNKNLEWVGASAGFFQ